MELVIPAFIAGLFTFLAPCTLPLVPGYLAFISGASSVELEDPEKVKHLRKKVILNGLFFVLGFSLVFITLGLLAGFIGGFLAVSRIWLARIGGLFVMFFGLFMLNIIRIPALSRESHIRVPKFFERGRPSTSLVLGSAFGVGWTPCVGPVLGAVLTVAATSGALFQGAFLLSVFSIGLGIPFIVIAYGIGSASKGIQKYIAFIEKYKVYILFLLGIVVGFLVNVVLLSFRSFSDSDIGILLLEDIPYIIPLVVAALVAIFGRKLNADPVSASGGLILILIGLLLATNNFALLLSYSFRILSAFGLESLEESLYNFL